MHKKKIEVQIGKDSSGVSSDFNPIPTISCSISDHPSPSSSLFLVLPSTSPDDNSNNYNFATTVRDVNPNHQHEIVIDDVDLHPNPKSTPHKRPIFPQTTTITQSQAYPFSPETHFSKRFCGTKAVAIHLLHRLRHLRRLQTHIRLILLLSLPFFYFLVSHPSQSFVLDFLSALAFSTALLFSLNLGLPQLPSIRTLLTRSFPINLYSSTHSSKPPLPVFWSIGSKPKGNRRVNSGCWVQAYSNGDVYEGEFHKGKCSGCGVYYYYMSGRYEGDWVNGMYDGYGVETWVKGSRYRGQYRQGLRHGFGVYRFYTGDVYAGEWSNGRSHGCGVHTCEDGSRYAGELKWGVKHGLGCYHFRNRDTYAGEYFADKMHGFGVYSFANGHRYEGSWHEGRRQGFGVYTFRNGETQSGHWQNGVLDVPSSKNAMCVIDHHRSKVLNAVQKAYDAAGKMEERVNNVVTSANRAANAARVAAIKAVQKQMHQRRNSDELPIPMVQNLHHLPTQLTV
ncbi:MORN motif-containing protein [Cynara cardunculus var. scolymus]|uniref:MORN motif-containing protein n=1 Tax=Cynara cardunculus var. scolymus TaxID=59895 RepID=A0A103XEM5_CYNCS|nr:MORN motif-containing protein [Cynara cardunculus var. scolymus]